MVDSGCLRGKDEKKRARVVWGWAPARRRICQHESFTGKGTVNGTSCFIYHRAKWFGSKWNRSTAIRWIVIVTFFFSGFHGLRRMNLIDFYDPFTYPLAPRLSWLLTQCLDKYRMGWYKTWYNSSLIRTLRDVICSCNTTRSEFWHRMKRWNDSFGISREDVLRFCGGKKKQTNPHMLSKLA